MAIRSTIEWTQATWNPSTGCSKISLGCRHCYAETLFRRFESQWGKFSEIRLHHDRLHLPEKRRKATAFFVNSMSDLFHKDIPDSFIQDVFQVMNTCSQHVFQILTKRADRLGRIDRKVKWTPNIWLGVTIENDDYYKRADYLRDTNARIKFISFEPLLSSVRNVDLNSIDWIIVGGESGRNPREIRKEWIEELLHRAKHERIPFFFKQWGGRSKKKSGCTLNGHEYKEMPTYFNEIGMNHSQEEQMALAR